MDIVQGYKLSYPFGLERINILMNESINFNTYKESLSKNWYEKNKDKGLKDISNKLAYALKVYRRKGEKYYWTTFKGYEDSIKSKKVSGKSFLACNTKATNEYLNHTLVAYLCNRFVNPNISHWLESVGISFDEDLFALSELIQFIYRSNLRVKDGIGDVKVYIPAKRMRDILRDFIGNANV